MAKSFNNIFPAPETVYNRPLFLPVGVQPINSAPFVAPGGFVDVVRPVTILRPPAGVPFDALDRPYTCVHPTSFDAANNCLKGGGTYKSNTPCGPVADSVAAPMCPPPDGNLLFDARDSEGVLCSGPNFSGAIPKCADGSRPAVDCNNNPLPCGEKHNQAAVNCGDTICTAVMVSCPNGAQVPNLPYFNPVTGRCGCRGNCNPFTDPLPVPNPVGGCNGGNICRQDARECPDGGKPVGRNPCNNCEFDPCGGNFTEQPLVKVFVHPNPNNNKDTLFARNENNLSLPLAKLNMTREEMGDVLVSNMSPTRYAQELMNQRDIPNYVGISTNMPPAPDTTFDVAMADGRNQRMTFRNGPICGKGTKPTVFSNSLTLNDFLNNNLNVNDNPGNPQGPRVFICTFRNDNFVFGGGGQKPKIAFNPKGDCNLPVANNGILAGALPVLSLVAASNFSDVREGEAPASIPTRSVRPVGEPLSILKDRAASSFLLTKSNSVARNGNTAGLDAQIAAAHARMVILVAARQQLIDKKAADQVSVDTLEAAKDAMYFYGTKECWSYYRTELGQDAQILKACIRPGTEIASCVEYSVPSPSGGPSLGENYSGVGTFYVTLKDIACIDYTLGQTLQDVLNLGKAILELKKIIELTTLNMIPLESEISEKHSLIVELQQEKEAIEDSIITT